MEQFLQKLYEVENFGTYIVIAIAVLTILFIIILFLGKKDQKLEETKRLEKIALDGFKDESEKVKNQVANVNTDVFKEEAKLEVIEPVKEETKVVDVTSEVKDTEIEEMKSNDVEVTEVPIVKEEVNVINSIDDIETMEEEKPLIEETKLNIELPEFDFTKVEDEIKGNDVVEEVKTVVSAPKFEASEIFSSVFVNSDKAIEEDEIIDLTGDDEDVTEIDLPKLKEEPVFNINEIKGETYDINK